MGLPSAHFAGEGARARAAPDPALTPLVVRAFDAPALHCPDEDGEPPCAVHAALPLLLPALLSAVFPQLLLALLGCVTSLVLKLVIVPLARDMALELGDGDAPRGRDGAALEARPPFPRPSPALPPTLLLLLLVRITSLVRAQLVAPLACGTLLEMAAEAVGEGPASPASRCAAPHPCTTYLVVAAEDDGMQT